MLSIRELLAFRYLPAFHHVICAVGDYLDARHVMGDIVEPTHVEIDAAGGFVRVFVGTRCLGNASLFRGGLIDLGEHTGGAL